MPSDNEINEDVHSTDVFCFDSDECRHEMPRKKVISEDSACGLLKSEQSTRTADVKIARTFDCELFGFEAPCVEKHSLKSTNKNTPVECLPNYCPCRNRCSDKHMYEESPTDSMTCGDEGYSSLSSNVSMDDGNDQIQFEKYPGGGFCGDGRDNVTETNSTNHFVSEENITIYPDTNNVKTSKSAKCFYKSEDENSKKTHILTFKDKLCESKNVNSRASQNNSFVHQQRTDLKTKSAISSLAPDKMICIRHNKIDAYGNEEKKTAYTVMISRDRKKMYRSKSFDMELFVSDQSMAIVRISRRLKIGKDFFIN